MDTSASTFGNDSDSDGASVSVAVADNVAAGGAAGVAGGGDINEDENYDGGSDGDGRYADPDTSTVVAHIASLRIGPNHQIHESHQQSPITSEEDDSLSSTIEPPDLLIPGYNGSLDENNQRHGYGVEVFTTRDVYIGQYRNGRFNGTGRLCYQGRYYEGTFRNDVLHGFGTCQYRNGSVYQGYWQNGLRHGRGTFRDHSTTFDHIRQEDAHNINGNHEDGNQGNGDDHHAGALYLEGDWRDDQPHGNIVARFPDGSTYTGSFAHGTPHGYGERCWPNRREYAGEWQRGHQHGIGWLSFPDGSIRLGQFIFGTEIQGATLDMDIG